MVTFTKAPKAILPWGVAYMFLMYNLYHHLIFTHKKLTMATINNLLAQKQPASLQPNAIDAFNINIHATNAKGSKFRHFLVEQEEKVDKADDERYIDEQISFISCFISVLVCLMFWYWLSREW
jgi:hypothetical protein